MGGLQICFVVLTYFLGTTSGVYKRWIPDTNFGNPSNWNEGRAPCGNDVAIIPEESPVVYVQSNTTIKELRLPKHGELILAPNSVLSFSERQIEGCQDQGGEVEFTAVHPMSWFDPDNWCSTNTERSSCDVRVFALDVERIPCPSDDVIFPRDHLYFVDLSEDTPIVTAKSLKISGTTFTTVTFKNYSSSRDGGRMFRLPSTSVDRVNITRKGCQDARGCVCGNDRPEIATVVCSHAEKRCSRPKCSKTIQPVGSCCRMCGAIFNITRGYGFNFNSFISSLKEQFLADTNLRINVTSSITSEGWVQLVLTDQTGETSTSVANVILKDLNKDLDSGGHKYAIDGVKLSLDTASSSAAHSTDTSMTDGSIIGIVVGVIFLLILLGAIVLVFVFKRTNRHIVLPSVHLPSWSSLSRRAPWGRAPPADGPQLRSTSRIDPGFANPVYDTSPFDDSNTTFKEMQLMEAFVEQQPTFDISAGGFHNPLFGTSEKSLFSEPTEPPEESPESPPQAVTAASASSSATTQITIHNSSINGDSTI